MQKLTNLNQIHRQLYTATNTQRGCMGSPRSQNRPPTVKQLKEGYGENICRIKSSTDAQREKGVISVVSTLDYKTLVEKHQKFNQKTEETRYSTINQEPSQDYKGKSAKIYKDEILKEIAQKRSSIRNEISQRLNLFTKCQSRLPTKSKVGVLKLKKQQTISECKIQDFVIGRTIGQGAYAQVKQAVHAPTGQKVALKVFDKSKFASETKRNSIQNEINILRKVSHPNIVQFYDWFETISHVYIVMEYVQGQPLTLFRKLAQGIDERRIKQIFRQIVLGIQHLHNSGIIHRDIKLDNALITNSNQVKIIDFGFSVLETQPTNQSIFCGTPVYMAPELVNKKKMYSKEGDIWALGVMLFSLLSGNFPFKGNTDDELFAQIKRGVFQYPSSISNTAKGLIQRMMAMNPSNRMSIDQILNQPWVQQIEFFTSQSVNDGWKGLSKTTQQFYGRSQTQSSQRRQVRVYSSSRNLI